jgi:DNA-binding ferritin-like protein
MANILPVLSGIDRKETRSVGRALARLDAQTEFGVARISQAAELQAERTVAVGYVAKRAMQEVALLSQLEAQLSMVVPMATCRLQALGDIAALEAADVVSQTVRRVSR